VNDPAYVKIRHELQQRVKRRMVEAGETEPKIRHSSNEVGRSVSVLQPL
jgi:hypothetical protein